MTREEAIQKITAERQKQIEVKFFTARHDAEHDYSTWFMVLAQQVGKLVRNLLGDETSKYAYTSKADRIAQVAAVCVAWLETIEDDE